MVEKEKKIEGFDWITNVNPNTEYIKEGRCYKEKPLPMPRSNGNIAKEYADRFQVPFGDIMVTDSQAFSGMKAVYRRKNTSKTEPVKAKNRAL